MRILPIIMFLLLIMAGACRHEERNIGREQAVSLYSKICSTTIKYTDSIRNAGDSATVDALRDRFEERLVEINYSVAPDTDYSLSEGENDTIKMRLDSLVAMHARRLSELGKPKDLPLDSIDSIGTMEKMHLTSSAVKLQ